MHAILRILFFSVLSCILFDTVNANCTHIESPSADVLNNTRWIQAALDGGGCIIISGGDYMVAALVVKSHTDLIIRADSRLVAVINVTKRAVLHVENATDVTLSGGGGIHGSAENAWLYYSALYNRFEPNSHDNGIFRPNVLLVSNSQNIVVRDLKLHNSSDWTFRMDNSTNIYVDNVDIYGDSRFPNNDGFDPESCTNITLVNSRIDVADDGICPKAGTLPLSGLTVRNTTVRSKSHAIKFGSNTDSEMSNILFDNITIWDSNGGMSIQQRSEGDIINVTWSNIVVETRYQAARWWGNGEWLAITNSPRDNGRSIGAMHQLRFINITGRSENGGLLSGISGTGATDILFENVHILISSWSNYSSARGVEPQNLCSADTQICSNETHPKCVTRTAPVVAPGTAIPCWGTHDYRPHDGGNCSFGCRTPATADGIHLENAHNVRFLNVSFAFECPRKQWFGHCFSADHLSSNITGASQIICQNGPGECGNGV